jgi:hypothetical protein
MDRVIAKGPDKGPGKENAAYNGTWIDIFVLYQNRLVILVSFFFQDQVRFTERNFGILVKNRGFADRLSVDVNRCTGRFGSNSGTAGTTGQ